MKCIVLAGGSGDRLWPLSRKNLPKQFIQIQGDHSIFQETIARNIPYCDEFIIVTNEECKFTAVDQVSAFQELPHRFILEGVGRKTSAAITMACMGMSLSEIVLVVPSDQLVFGGTYKDDLMAAKGYCEDGKIVVFGMPNNEPDNRFGFIEYKDENVLTFTEKPDKDTLEKYSDGARYLINGGMFLFRVGDYLHELKNGSKMILDACETAYRMRKKENSGFSLSAEVMQTIPAVSVEKAVFEKVSDMKVIHAGFEWRDIGCLEDIKETEIKTASEFRQIQYNCSNTDVVNQCNRRAVVVNGIDDAIVVNTKDVVYVGKKGASGNIKNIIAENDKLLPFVEGGRVLYRQWGTYELLVDTPNYRVKKVIIGVGKTIFAHKHIYRSEHWIITSGNAIIDLDGDVKTYQKDDVIDVLPGVVHQVANSGVEPLVIIEVSIGENVSEDDKVSVTTLREEESTISSFEPIVKLRPAFKDYLWGGTKLKEIYNKKCDYDILAESWELSAHDGGMCYVDSGRYKGLAFTDYLDIIGKANWGWKCRPLEGFPVLVKFIDAKGSLSIQVHPDDEYALAVENQYGKNEMWYIIDAEPDSYLYCGFNRDVTKEEVGQRIKDNTILEVLNKISVKPGETYFIPAGTVHAIGAGLLICEIQQSSNCTYRLYDYDRRDKFGNLRELHVDKALDVLRFDKYNPQRLDDEVIEEAGYRKHIISRCKYFECSKYEVVSSVDIQGIEESFTSIICISGTGTINSSSIELEMSAGESFFMPKSTDTFTINGKCEFIMTRI